MFLGESIMFTGSVSKYDEDRSLRISVFDFSKNLIITKKIPVDNYGKFSYTVELEVKNFLMENILLDLNMEILNPL